MIRWKVKHGDCIEVLKRLPEACVDSIVTDPPYGTSETSRSKVVIRNNKVVKFHHAWDKELILDWLVEGMRVLRPGAAILSFTDNKRVGDLWAAGEACGLKGLHTFYWEKPDCPPTPRPNFASAVESGVFFRKPGAVLAWNGGGWSRNIFKAPLAHKEHDGHTRYHPTEKTLSLMRWLVRLVTPPGGLVVDPFCGSGSTGVAAMYEGFRFLGIEQDAEYVKTAVARLQGAADKVPLPIDPPEAA